MVGDVVAASEGSEETLVHQGQEMPNEMKAASEHKADEVPVAMGRLRWMVSEGLVAAPEVHAMSLVVAGECDLLEEHLAQFE